MRIIRTLQLLSGLILLSGLDSAPFGDKLDPKEAARQEQLDQLAAQEAALRAASARLNQRLEQIAAQRGAIAARRDTSEEDDADAQDKLADAQDERADAKDELADAQDKLADAQDERADAKDKLADAQDKLADAEDEQQKTQCDSAGPAECKKRKKVAPPVHEGMEGIQEEADPHF